MELLPGDVHTRRVVIEAGEGLDELPEANGFDIHVHIVGCDSDEQRLAEVRRVREARSDTRVFAFAPLIGGSAPQSSRDPEMAIAQRATARVISGLMRADDLPQQRRLQEAGELLLAFASVERTEQLSWLAHRAAETGWKLGDHRVVGAAREYDGNEWEVDEGWADDSDPSNAEERAQRAVRLAGALANADQEKRFQAFDSRNATGPWPSVDATYASDEQMHRLFLGLIERCFQKLEEATEWNGVIVDTHDALFLRLEGEPAQVVCNSGGYLRDIVLSVDPKEHGWYRDAAERMALTMDLLGVACLVLHVDQWPESRAMATRVTTFAAQELAVVLSMLQWRTDDARLLGLPGLADDVADVLDGSDLRRAEQVLVDAEATGFGKLSAAHHDAVHLAERHLWLRKRAAKLRSRLEDFFVHDERPTTMPDEPDEPEEPEEPEEPDDDHLVELQHLPTPAGYDY